ncbi:hypothetical protein KBD49_11415 [Myxococcota bacterium]|nr:hypothetical protein [Myxococcota bacterium]
MKAMLRFAAVVVLLASWACDTGGAVGIPSDPGRADWLPWVEDVPDVRETDAPADTGSGNPTDLPGTDGTAPEDQGPEGPRDAVIPGEYLPARSMRFRMAGREGDDLLVEVVGRDFTGVFGIALRVEWDPALATLVSATPGTALDSAGDTTGAAAEVRPGSLAIGLALGTYADAADWTGDRVVATLRLRPLGTGPVPLSFQPARSMVFDGGLARQDVAWLPAVAYP